MHSPVSINGCESVKEEVHRCVVCLLQQRGHITVDVQSGVLIF